jgi:hypothetical protein
MSIWRYAWTLGPLLAALALGVNLAVQGFLWIGLPLLVVAVLGLLLVLLKEAVERPERAHAYYEVEGSLSTYRYSYVEFYRLPETVRDELMQNPKVSSWFTREMHRHAAEAIAAPSTRLARWRRRLWLRVLYLLT